MASSSSFTAASAKRKRVSFQEEEQNDVFEFVSQNRELCSQLFYTPEDYSQFRSQFHQEKKQRALIQKRIRLLKEQARGDATLSRQQVAKLQMRNVPIPMPRPTHSVFRTAMQGRKGCAQMA